MDIDWNVIKSEGLPNFRFNYLNTGYVIRFILLYAFPAAGILVLLYLLWGGLQLMTSGGDPKAIQAARDKITGALVGLVIIFTAFWVVQILASFLGVPVLRDAF